MGRLDDAAKHKVVELRKAGLSFRKIKAVLELENIKVSAQAIYLFLREFQGRPPGRVRPVEAGSSTSPAQVQPRAGAVQESWSNINLQNLLREASHHAGFTPAANFAKQTSTNTDTGAKPSGSGEIGGGSRPEQQHEGDKEENDIQIVSVTSLAQNIQQRSPQSSVTRAEAGTVSSTLTASGAFMRRRVTPSPATNSMLAARKRLLDKALSHRMKVPTYIFLTCVKIPIVCFVIIVYNGIKAVQCVQYHVNQINFQSSMLYFSTVIPAGGVIAEERSLECPRC